MTVVLICEFRVRKLYPLSSQYTLVLCLSHMIKNYMLVVLDEGTDDIVVDVQG